MGRSLVFFESMKQQQKNICVRKFFFIFISSIHYVAVGECNNKKNGRHLLELKKKKKFFHGIHPFIYLSIYVVYNHEMNFFHFFYLVFDTRFFCLFDSRFFISIHYILLSCVLLIRFWFVSPFFLANVILQNKCTMFIYYHQVVWMNPSFEQDLSKKKEKNFFFGQKWPFIHLFIHWMARYGTKEKKISGMKWIEWITHHNHHHGDDDDHHLYRVFFIQQSCN